MNGDVWCDESLTVPWILADYNMRHHKEGQQEKTESAWEWGEEGKGGNVYGWKEEWIGIVLDNLIMATRMEMGDEANIINEDYFWWFEAIQKMNGLLEFLTKGSKVP